MKLAGKSVKIMGDIQGPKFRVGLFKNQEVHLKEGQTFTLDSDGKEGDETRVYLPHPEFIATAQIGDQILINDGIVELRVTDKVNNKKLVTVVETAGPVSNRKGISLPERVIPAEFPTQKDRVSIQTALELGLDTLMLSFVQTAGDVQKVKDLTFGKMHLMAKIETPAAYQNLPEIAKVADSILIARGDLGVEAKQYNVPKYQRNIAAYCIKNNIPVTLAT